MVPHVASGAPSSLHLVDNELLEEVGRCVIVAPLCLDGLYDDTRHISALLCVLVDSTLNLQQQASVITCDKNNFLTTN
ncbi:hypothetical protein NP493_921g01082 [Ridgeia piscesae]|uniref:Uncharacterized protein n=1 Tax=Ridgeia piscesae TaxID=27915 RepID=A0AAD9KKH4_RIDPI|nr:hypothetical protein NP493_921g01082 [Ridgeia piscesae]